MENNTQILFVMTGYLLLLILWGLYQCRKVKTTSDYAIAGMLFTIIWISTGMEEVITSRVMTFLVAGAVAVIATYALPEKKSAL